MIRSANLTENRSRGVQKFIDAPHIPRLLGHVPAIQERIDIVEHQDRLIPLRLVKSCLFFSLAESGRDQLDDVCVFFRNEPLDEIQGFLIQGGRKVQEPAGLNETLPDGENPVSISVRAAGGLLFTMIPTGLALRVASIIEIFNIDYTLMALFFHIPMMIIST